ncbi:MAG: SDR family oxidoreductase, partial [Pirellulales bacterium]
AEELQERKKYVGTFLADLNHQQGVDALIQDIQKNIPVLDTVVLIAGADVLTGVAATWSFEEKLQSLLNVDVVATMRLARSFGAIMAKGSGGSIVTIGWDQAATGMAGDSGELFAATKGAVMAFTKSLAKSLAPNVRVNCVAPGWIRTAWGENASQTWQQRAVQESMLGRWGTPEDIASVVRWVVSKDAGFVTGQIINVNGGLK